MRHLRAALAAVMLCSPTVARAQTVRLPQVINAGGASVPAFGSVAIDSSGMEKATNANPSVTIGKQESFKLIANDVAVISATVAGGDYALSQTCTTYGTLNLQILGPDGSTWQTLISKTTADTAGATGVSLGSYATVRITTSGASGCNAILARIPA